MLVGASTKQQKKRFIYNIVVDATSDNLPPFPSLEPGAGFRRTITVNYLY